MLFLCFVFFPRIFIVIIFVNLVLKCLYLCYKYNNIVLLAASRQGFKYCTWFISSKMYRNTEDIKFEIYVEISTGTTISQEMLKQTVNKNNIHVPVGVSQVSQLVVMILLINDCYVMSLVVIISRMNFVLYRNKHVRFKFVFIFSFVCLFFWHFLLFLVFLFFWF